ncbi:MAG: VENN motif pre-toxin domain-containing protein [Acinetobacter sp.]
MVSHAILGATLAYVNGGNPAAGGTAAVASEAAANYFAKQYDDGKTAINPKTGEFDPNLLPEGVKTSIRDLTAAIGVAVGGTVGDSAFNAQLAGVVGQNAVENNEFSIVSQGVDKTLAENRKKKEIHDKLLAACKNQSCIIPIPEKGLGDKAIALINDLTVKQIAAALGSPYDPLTKVYFTQKDIEEAKVAMLSLGFSKTLNGPIKLTDEAIENIGKKYGKDITKIVMEPEADFAGRVPVRPRDGYINAGTKQIDTPLGKHLIEAAVNKKSKIISGGHNADNFYEILNANGGKLVGQPTQISKGIIEVKYQLPNGRIQPKTIYDPKVYNDAQMASMANQAAAKAIVNYGVNGKAQQNVVVNGITFRVPIDTRSGAPKVPTSFPINPKTP